MLVFADHALETYFPEFREKNHLAHHLGRLGVLLFFVHTARVLMSSLERIGSARAFYVRRIFRIYPLAIVCIILALVFAVPPVPWREYAPHDWADLASNFLLTQNLTWSPPVIGPLWSLPIELQMYAVLPLIYVLRRHIWVIFGLSVFGAVFIAPFSDVLGVIKYAPCFVAGVIAFTSNEPDRPIQGWLWFLALVVIVYVGLELVIPGIHNIWLQIGVCLVVGLAIPRFAQIRAQWFNTLSNRIARYSYGIYLFHCAALWAAPELFSAIILTAVMSIASYHYIEAPMIRLGSRLSAGSREKVLAT